MVRPDRAPLGVGLDGCKAGWVAASFDGQALAFRLFDSIEAWAADDDWQAPQTLIDMPIGLLSAGCPGDPPYAPGVRGCDAAARRLLGPRRSSVFAAPSREALAAPDYPSANAANRAAIGKGLSKQAYYLIPKVREVDR
ncbi:MAG: DUF429 domain-containing protein, partial [Planctomycetota bacterium]